MVNVVVLFLQFFVFIDSKKEKKKTFIPAFSAWVHSIYHSFILVFLVLIITALTQSSTSEW